MPTISATIITKNEEQDIASCIESILWTDEIIVLDCGSTDQTKDICKKYSPKVKFYEADWPGFGKQKNRALELASSDWALSIDADETVSSELKLEILEKINNAEHTAYKIPRQNYFLGKPIKYCFGNKKDAPIRLFKKGTCKFSDEIVHEKIITSGTTGKLHNTLDHVPCSSIEELMNKTNSYSSLTAIKSPRKTSPLKAFGFAVLAFTKIYFFKRGFLDGWPGFLLSFSHFEGALYKNAKILEKRRCQV